MGLKPASTERAAHELPVLMYAATWCICDPDVDPRPGCHYRARYYDPAGGRFLSEDPIKFGGGTNFYGYAGNDPVGFRDATGLDYHYGFDPATNTITIGASVVIWGPNANGELANTWQRDTNRYWNAQLWKYGKCTVRFNFNFSVGGPNSLPGENNIYVLSNPLPGNVLGASYSNGGYWWQGIVDQDVAHEMGHLLLLGDDYGRIMPDWLFNLIYGNHDGHMMSNSVIRNVAQHEVDEIAGRTACQCEQ